MDTALVIKFWDAYGKMMDADMLHFKDALIEFQKIRDEYFATLEKEGKNTVEQTVPNVMPKA